MGIYFQAHFKLIIKVCTLAGILACMLISRLAFAQDAHLLDSLGQKLTEATAEEKAKIWARLAQAFSGKQIELSRQYADSAIHLAEEVNDPETQAKALTYLGYYYYDMGNLDSALMQMEKGLTIDRKINNKKGIANQMNAISHIYVRRGDYQKALETYQEALQMERKIGNANGISAKLNNIGTLYQELDMYPEAIDYYLQALEVNQANGFGSKAAMNHKNIGWIYMLRSDYIKALPHLKKGLEIARKLKDQYQAAVIYDHLGLLKFNTGEIDSARFFYEKSLQVCRDLNNLAVLSVVLANLSDVYRETDDFEKTKTLLEESLELQAQIKDSVNLSIGNQKLAELYLEQEDYEKALYHANIANSIAQQRQYRKALHEAKGVLSEIYHRLGNSARSYQLIREQMLIKDTLYREEKEKRFEELEIRYQAEKKEREIERLNQDKLLQEAKLSRANLLRNFSAGSLLLLSAAGFLFLRQRRIRQQARENELAHQLEIEQLEASRLQEVDQVKSRFFANIAHEFRTPLTLISGPIAQLSEEAEAPAQRKQLRLVQRNADRLLSLINQVMDLSRLESGLLKLNEEPTELVSFLRGLTYSFQSLAEQKNIALNFETETESVHLLTDRDKLEKVVSNLLSNAFKFTPEEGSIAVRLEIDPKENVFRLAVTDSGSGISPEQLTKIFDRFYQADNAHLQQEVGSGIGLSLSKELVELMGGSMAAESVPEQGSAFGFTLPIVGTMELPNTPSAPNASANEWVDEQTTIADESLKPEQAEVVLIVEDNPDVRQFIRESVSAHYRVLEAENGKEGVRMAQQEIPDLIISDLMMPQMDGYEACRLIKEDEKTSHIPVILLTAKAGMEHKLEGLETGADDYLAKPFHTKELLTRIRNLIRLRQQLKQKYLSQVLEDKPVQPQTKEDTFLKKMREAVEAHLDQEDFSIEDLSREVGMSRTQVHRKLKALTAQSASQFMRSIRLRHGMKLLRESDLTVSEIAYQVGFGSVSYFTKCFGEEFGSKPSEVREVKTS